jgi:hypothetical protein
MHPPRFSSARRVDKCIKCDDAAVPRDDYVEACDLGWFACWAVAPGLTSDIEEGLRRADRCEHEARKSFVQLRYGVIYCCVAGVATVRIGKDAIRRPERRNRAMAFRRVALAKDIQQVSQEKISNCVIHGSPRRPSPSTSVEVRRPDERHPRTVRDRSKLSSSIWKRVILSPEIVRMMAN